MRIKVSIPTNGDRQPELAYEVDVLNDAGEEIGRVMAVEVYSDEIEIAVDLHESQDAWLQIGLDRGYAKPFCGMHDMAPLSDEEKALDYDDPCAPSLRVWRLP